jgi:hypothetical protein
MTNIILYQNKYHGRLFIVFGNLCPENERFLLDSGQFGKDRKQEKITKYNKGNL